LRPRYENAESLRLETSFRQHLENIWGVTLEKLKISYEIDCGVTKNDRVVGLAELKCRRYNFGDFPTYLLSLQKFRTGIVYSRVMHVPFVLMVEWLGRGDNPPEPSIKQYVFQKSHLDIIDFAMAGRRDRNDPDDIEICAMIPQHLFTELTDFFPGLDRNN